jgi:outer membrane receptor protein involved in Fe transport
MNRYVVSYDSNVWVPWQYELNAAVFYRQPRWEVRLDVGNLTDQRNFVPAINDNNGADAITISQPINLQASFRFHF